MDMVNVDFEWFDPQPIDFHGLKILLRQLFDSDAQDFDMSALADMILAQPLLGSTVKVDGNESDPYAFLTVLNLQEHKVCCAEGLVLRIYQRNPLAHPRNRINPSSRT
jgi:protein BCP1